jgi:hypothetical protein
MPPEASIAADGAHVDAQTGAGAGVGAREVGRFEQLPKWLNLVPMVLQWLWLSLRHGSVTLPSSANPGITAGGLVGEGKLEYFGAMGPLARAATAPAIGVHNTADLHVGSVLGRLADAGLPFPLVAKPDLGWCGFGVRRLDDAAALGAYLREFPVGETVVLQRYLPGRGEAGLFYLRHPDAVRGTLFGVLLRDAPAVTGNGRDTVAALVAADPRLRRATHNAHHDCRFDGTRIPGRGERVALSTVASTRVGGHYRDGTALATEALLARVDAIARDMGCFLAGRFDVRYADEAALQRGEFTIIEVNGAGSEAVHAWDPKYRIRDVYRIVFAKQRALFAIAAANRRRGHPPIGVRALARLFFRQRRLIARYPASN